MSQNDLKRGIVTNFEKTIFSTSQGYASAIDISDPSSPTLIWEKRYSKNVFSSFSKICYVATCFVDDQKDLYIAGKTHVYKMAADNGKYIWKSVQLTSKFIQPMLILNYNDTIISVCNTRVHCISKKDGKTIWHNKLRSFGFATATISNDKLYVSIGGTLIVYYAMNGKQLCKIQMTSQTDQPSCIVHSSRKKSSRLYVSLEGRLFLFDTNTMEMVKSKRILDTKDQILSLYAFKNIIIVGSPQKLISMRQRDLSERWSRNMDGQKSIVSIQLSDYRNEKSIVCITRHKKNYIKLNEFSLNGSKRSELISNKLHDCVGSSGAIIHYGNICIGASCGTIIIINEKTKSVGLLRTGFFWTCLSSINGYTDPNQQPLIHENYVFKKMKKL